MSGWTKERDRILQTLIGKTGIRILVVEGEDDVDFFKALLDEVARGQWAVRWDVSHANGKKNVLKIIDDQPDWLGIVDRDEWSDSAVTAIESDSVHQGRLFVLPRYCMESYFIDPDEIWATLPAMQQASVQGGKGALDVALTASLAQWVRHGALWRAVNPLWEGLSAIGFKDDLLDLQAAQNDQTISTKLGDWHAYLDPVRIFREFQAHLQTAVSESRGVQLRRWVHGKRYFSGNVAPVLSQFLGQKGADEWLLDLRRTLPLPADLAFLWARMQLP